MPPRQLNSIQRAASGSNRRAKAKRLNALTFALLSILTSFSLSDLGAQAGTGESEFPQTFATNAEGETEPAFAGRRGVGVVKTFLFPKRRVDNRLLYVADPYLPPWKYEMLRGRLDEIRRAGFDFLRISIDPGPIFSAGSQDIEKRLKEIDFAVSSSLQSGLKVVLDVHVSEGHPHWNFRKVTAGTEQPVFRRYLKVLSALAGIIDDYDPKLVALEVFNEPPPPCEWSDRLGWPQQLDIIYQHVRRSAPRHTLIVSGACWASIRGLLLLNGSKFDSNTMFTFHYYEPNIFTMQGYWHRSMKYLQHIAPLPYPPEPTKLPATLTRVEEAIGKARNIDSNSRPSQFKQAKKRIENYFAKFSGQDSILADFAKVRAWADSYGIPPQRILLGEFGAMKDVYGYKGANVADRARWLSDVREAAEINGFSWSVWALTNAMGIVTGDLRGPLDPTVLDALGLEVQ